MDEKMTEEQDEREFEEFKALHRERYRLIPDWALKQIWLASRRLLREKYERLELHKEKGEEQDEKIKEIEEKLEEGNWRSVSMRNGFQKKMVSPREAAEIYPTSPGTLANLRSQGRGPKFFKVNRKVLYRVEDLDLFFMANPIVTTDSRG